MSSRGKLEPHRITKPIQLLAAWLLGLIFVNGAFLVAAAQIDKPAWVSGALIVAAIVNVPIFLVSIFLLQTKFRPEMQEDSFYSQYLETKTGNTAREITAESVATLREDFASLEKVVAERIGDELGEQELKKLQWSSTTVMLNKNLDNFSQIAKQLSNNGIPIHETFGGGAGRPEVLKVAIGTGFDIDQIRALINAILVIGDGWISFAHHDDEGPGQYDNTVLIGAYGSYKHGIEISKAKTFLDSHERTIADVYKIIGKYI